MPWASCAHCLQRCTFIVHLFAIMFSQLDVKEAKKVESHPQWEITDDEEEKEDEEGSDSAVSSDEDYSEEDWMGQGIF